MQKSISQTSIFEKYTNKNSLALLSPDDFVRITTAMLVEAHSSVRAFVAKGLITDF